MVKIRLARAGRKKIPCYRVVVANSRAPRDGKFIEIVGGYYPLLSKDNSKRISLKLDRIKHWIGNGAQMSERVEKIFNIATAK